MAVLNAQSDAARRLAATIKRRTLWYAIEEQADLIAHIHSMDARGSEFSIQFNNYMERVRTPLCGRHNISNHLAAAGLCLAAGFSLSAIAQGLSLLECVPGRLEPVDSPAAQRRGIGVLVDYAHTDDALRNVLSTVRPLCAGRLILVFGCGGDRDKTKRPRMAQAAEAMADVVIVTSDNPRTEDPEAIIHDIYVGFSPDKRRCTDCAGPPAGDLWGRHTGQTAAISFCWRAKDTRPIRSSAHRKLISAMCRSPGKRWSCFNGKSQALNSKS